jgi:acetyl/propionyl-CoA carboxylase alpha subunit
MFQKILIANRGEVARRVIKTCRRLGIGTVAVYSDADAGLLHVTDADAAVRLGEAPLAKSYLDQAALLRAIRESGADAVHPGYGLLSENASFAAAVRALGVTFIGPSTEALSTFGDKLSARALARSLGVQPPPGTEAAVNVTDTDALAAAAATVGYPLIVKAAGGGGGIGMVRVEAPAELAAAVATSAARGAAAFGNARVYLERYLERSRHIEVQVLGAGRDHVLAFGERECSVQRRHQKLIEETPSPAAFFERSVEARPALVRSAIELVRATDYVGLATVEFVVDSAGTPYFLEVNPRLQVEHGITELVFGVDLVELQLRALAGELPAAPAAAPRGHAIEVRLYAEDPARNFAPQPGLLRRFRFPETGADFRVDTGFREGDTITQYYDPLLAKVMARGDSRASAIEQLVRGLEASEVQLEGKTGARQSNLQLMIEILKGAAFASGQYTTHLVNELFAARVKPAGAPPGA